MTETAAPLVVIGLGQVLRADDAAGIRVVEAVRERAAADPTILPPATRLVDGGTVGAGLAGWIRGCRGLVLADAVRLGGTVGAVTVLRGEAAEADAAADGTPGDARGELLALARLMDWLPAEVSLVGIEIADLDLGLQLSPAVAAAIPDAAQAVITELDRIAGRPGGRFRGGHAARMAGALA